ncbi:MAG: protein kinase domain-containing protein [Acidimicrobiales bacterium]
MGSEASGERIVAGWILEGRLGRGSYGEVWQARRRHVDLVRALKLIPIVEEASFEAWRHEIGRLGALNHPNVVRFYDADIVSDGPYRNHAWIVTELCERSLAQTLGADQSRLLPSPEAERVLEAMLAALAAAHGAGMVHRDLKPANILRHHSGTWKLCDFGTARLLPTDATHPATRVIGTSPYMSRAAHRGHQNQAADLYALGVTLHEALRGERLHRRPEGMTDSEYVKLVLDTPPTIARDLPRRWRSVVAALIGEYGRLDAAQLATWYAETRGDRAPSNAGPPVVTAQPTAMVTARQTVTTKPTVVAARRMTSQPVVVAGPMAPRVKRRRRQRPGAIQRTEARGGTPGRIPALVAPPASPPPPQLHVPAPVPAPASPPSSGPSASTNGSAGSRREPVAPAHRPAASSPPTARSTPPAAPPSSWPGRDPTAVLGRRVVAAVLDGVFVLVLAAVFFFGAVVARYDKVPVPPEASGPQEACDVLGRSSTSCVTVGRDVYVATGGSLTFPPFVALAALVVLVLVQGLTGATLGKLLVGLRMVGPGGRPAGLIRAFVRTACLVVDGLPWVVPILGWLIARHTTHHRRLGDIVARTVVVRRRAVARRR